MNHYRLRDLLFYFIKLGSFRFGGPVALVQSMRRDLLVEKKWFTEREYNFGLALAQMAPGPLASQLAIYFGWKKSGAIGGALALLSLVLPSFVLVCLLSSIYLQHQDLPWLKAVSLGTAGCVMALMLKSAVFLARGIPFKNSVHPLILAGSTIATVIFKSEVGWIFLIGGFLSWLHFNYLKRRNLKMVWIALLGGSFFSTQQSYAQSFIRAIADSGQWKLFQYFFEVGALVFGSGSVIIPFLYTGVVNDFHWLTENQFLDAIMVGMLTPGPVVITVAFVGYLVDGFTGALLSCIGIFLPCYLFVIIPAPFFEKISDQPDMQAAIDGMSTAATGAILGAAWMVAGKSLVQPLTIAVFGLSLLIVLSTKRIPEPFLIICSGLIGYFGNSYFIF